MVEWGQLLAPWLALGWTRGTESQCQGHPLTHGDPTGAMDPAGSQPREESCWQPRAREPCRVSRVKPSAWCGHRRSAEDARRSQAGGHRAAFWDGCWQLSQAGPREWPRLPIITVNDACASRCFLPLGGGLLVTPRGVWVECHYPHFTGGNVER